MPTKKLNLKNCAPFTNCTSEINNTETDHAKDIYVVIPMFNLIEYGDNNSKTSGILWKYSRDEPNLDDNGNVNGFPNNTDNTDSASFKFKQKITGQTGNYGTNGVEIIVPSKYISNFWRTPELSLFNCEINFFYLGLQFF